MKINKKNVIFIILTIFIIFITPIYSKANINEYTIKIAELESEEVPKGGSTGPLFGTDTGDGDPIDNPSHYKPGSPASSDVTTITNKVGPIFNIITTIGIVAGVLIIIIIGIKYMIGSIEEKAEYKKTMMPYLIGAIMLTSITGILKIFASIISNFTNKI